MLKKKQWFKNFRLILYEIGLLDEAVYALECGAKEEKMYETLTPKEATREFVDVEGG